VCCHSPGISATEGALSVGVSIGSGFLLLFTLYKHPFCNLFFSSEQDQQK
jgi:hypothetical protein